ncbi:MAG: hypothetical protein J6X78_13730 [Treponema sp.]|nr:hypothetical protein [Treponema sp.]
MKTIDFIKILSKGFLIFLLLLPCSCKKQKSDKQLDTTNTNLVTNSENTSGNETTISNSLPKIDYDLSNMNFTMISSFFFQMLIEPETYENKIFKIKGNFQTFDNPEGKLPYFSVIMNDSTMCCQEGIDFVWQGEHNWPQDYPEAGTEILIIGKYIVTEEDGFTYNYLLVSDILPEMSL